MHGALFIIIIIIINIYFYIVVVVVEEEELVENRVSALVSLIEQSILYIQHGAVNCRCKIYIFYIFFFLKQKNYDFFIVESNLFILKSVSDSLCNNKQIQVYIFSK